MLALEEIILAAIFLTACLIAIIILVLLIYCRNHFNHQSSYRVKHGTPIIRRSSRQTVGQLSLIDSISSTNNTNSTINSSSSYRRHPPSIVSSDEIHQHSNTNRGFEVHPDDNIVTVHNYNQQTNDDINRARGDVNNVSIDSAPNVVLELERRAKERAILNERRRYEFYSTKLLAPSTSDSASAVAGPSSRTLDFEGAINLAGNSSSEDSCSDSFVTGTKFHLAPVVDSRITVTGHEPAGSSQKSKVDHHHNHNVKNNHKYVSTRLDRRVAEAIAVDQFLDTAVTNHLDDDDLQQLAPGGSELKIIAKRRNQV